MAFNNLNIKQGCSSVLELYNKLTSALAMINNQCLPIMVIENLKMFLTVQNHKSIFTYNFKT